MDADIRAIEFPHISFHYFFVCLQIKKKYKIISVINEFNIMSSQISMVKYFSFFSKNIRPLSQNSRTLALVTSLGDALIAQYNSYPSKVLNFPLPRNVANWLTCDLSVKLFYIHKSLDRYDADNISKPLWDALNGRVYKDDFQNKYLETLKIDTRAVGSCEFDITNMDLEDLVVLEDFLFNPRNIDDKLLYIEVSDFNMQKIRF